MNDKKFVEYKCIAAQQSLARQMPADLCRAFAHEKARLVTVAQNRIHGLLTENFKESYNV